MAYDERLAASLKELIKNRRDFHTQKMFGGIGFLLRGNMCFGLYKEYLILRLGGPQAQKALARSGTKPFDITGRAMKGWVMVAPAGMKTKQSLRNWVGQAIDFVSTLPRK